jgi:poly(hydroxyalkanoate) granule-associated protein
MVMSKKLTELANEATETQLAAQIRETATQVRESATQIWLAGLGAFSKARQEGVKMFDALVAEGEKFQERTKTAADERFAEVREKVTETWDKLETGAWDRLEKVFEEPAGRALHALNVPSHKDIDALSKRVHELSAVTKKLSEEQEHHTRVHKAKVA